jgi:diadenosine tetraphosphate (Ap4A) HIT family hydrolase
MFSKGLILPGRRVPQRQMHAHYHHIPFVGMQETGAGTGRSTPFDAAAALFRQCHRR